MRLTVILACLVLAAAADHVRYDGFKVLEFHPHNQKDLHMIRGVDDERELEIIREPSLGRPGILMVSPRMFSTLREQFSTHNTPFNVYIDDVQREIDEERERLSRRVPYVFDADDFNDYDTIIAQLDKWVSICPDGVTCELATIGKSYEERPLRTIKIGKPGVNKKVIWIDATIHAREWIAIATIQKIIDYFITQYETDATVKRMVDEYDWYLLPLANPDGYVYTWNGGRLWRKNRRPFEKGCIGCDLNRNFDVTHWGKEGVSFNPCRDFYCGPSPGSEPETNATQKEMDRLFQNEDVVAWIALHGFGNMWMYPYAHTTCINGSKTCAVSPMEDYMAHITNVSVAALEATNNRQGKWRWGSICKTIYPVSGSITERAYEKKFYNSYTLELRGIFFVINKAQIHLSFTEVWNGLVAMLDEIKKVG